MTILQTVIDFEAAGEVFGGFRGSAAQKRDFETCPLPELYSMSVENAEIFAFAAVGVDDESRHRSGRRRHRARATESATDLF